MANQFSKDKSAPQTESQTQAEMVATATAAAISAVADALIARGPKSPLEMSGLSPEAQRALSDKPTPKKYRSVPGRSSQSGATFDMNVVESASSKNGRVTELRNYKFPLGMYTYQRDGGKVPDGFPIFNNNAQPQYAQLEKAGIQVPSDQLSVKYKQWRWTEFWQSDIRYYVGKHLVLGFCDGGPNPDEPDEELRLKNFKTAWVEPKVESDEVVAAE